MHRLKRRKDILNRLRDIATHPQNAVIVHYSCESFYDRPDGASPRITSIAVRNQGTAQTTSFSIHQMAEKSGSFSKESIIERYDDLEKKMLSSFMIMSPRIWTKHGFTGT